MTPRPTPPHEQRLRMTLEVALSREGEERGAFLAWLRTADPELAREVEARLAGDDDPPDRDP